MSPAGRSGVARPPLVTVVIPTHNRCDLVRQAVASVLAQTWTNLELVVVDDGSTDGTREALRSLADPRLRIISGAHSGNVALLRNRGVAASAGEWVAFLDSDDLWEPDKLGRQIHALEDSRAGWSYTGSALIDADGKGIPMRAGVFRAISGDVLKALISDETGACICSIVVAREVFDAVGGFDENLLSMEDLDFELRLAATAEAVALPDALVRVRDHVGRKTNNEAFHHEHSARVFDRVLRRRPVGAISQIARERCAVHLKAAAARRLAVGDYWRSLPLFARALILRVSLRRHRTSQVT